MKLMKLDSLDQKPNDYPISGTVTEKNNYAERVAQAVVDEIFVEVDLKKAEASTSSPTVSHCVNQRGY